jgi:hypothetical protein
LYIVNQGWCIKVYKDAIQDFVNVGDLLEGHESK